MLFDHVLPLVVLGCMAGFLSGLIGIGGGFVLVPGLVAVFHAERAGLAALPLAIGTTTACMLFTACSSAASQLRKGAINRQAVTRLGLVMGVFAAFGAGLTTVLAPSQVALVFGAFCVYSGLGFLFLRPQAGVPGWTVASGSGWPFGAACGLLCGLIGVGGTNVVVPYLLRRNVELRAALGTASALQVPIGLFGGITFALVGSAGPTAAGSLGLVNLPSLAVLAAASAAIAPFGVWASHRLPTATLRKLFGAVTTGVGLHMVGLF